MSFRPRLLLVLLATLVTASPALGQLRRLEAMAPARTIGMAGMGRSFAAGANALYLNPAALKVVPQYVLGSGYGYSNEDPSTHNLMVAWTDSSPNLYNLGFGVAYNYVFDDDNDSHNVHMTLAYTLPLQVMTIHLGATAHRMWNAYSSGEDMWTGDAGMVLDFSKQLLLGIVGYSLITENRELSPRGVGGGISYWKDRFMIGAEISAQSNELDSNNKEVTAVRYMGGMQLMVAAPVSLRGGVCYDANLKETRVAAGFTFVAQPIMGIELGYQQGITNTSDVLFSVMLELYNPFGSNL